MKTRSKAGWMGAGFGAALWLALAAPLGALSPSPVPSPSPGVAEDPGFFVLCYHRFLAHPPGKDERAESEYEMPLGEFKWQMQYLKDNGFHPISQDQLMGYWFQGKPLPPKPVLITFDDGFRSIYRDAFPVVKAQGYPSILFLYTQFIKNTETALEKRKETGKKSKEKPRVEALELPEILEMQKAGMVVESHTTHHLNMGLEREKKGTQAFARKLKNELTEPLEYIEAQFKRRPQWLAYPFGVYDPVILKATADAGYQLAFTVNPGPNDRTVPPLMLRRNLVLFPLGHEAFARIFKDGVLHLKDLTPADGALIDPLRPVLSAKITDAIDPRSVQLQLGNRSMRIRFDPKTGTFSHKVKADMTQGGHMLTLSAKAKNGRHLVYNWYFRIKHHKYEKQPPAEKEALHDATNP